MRIKKLKPVEKVIRVYSGRPGSTYGCYWPHDENQGISINDKKMINKIYKIFNEHINSIFTYDKARHFVYLNLKNRTYTMFYQDQ
jgi:hypothetical protein